MLSLIDYQFNQPDLLEQALTHRSTGANNNERLEYLGDALLGFIVAEHLYRRFPDADEGQLTRARAALVNQTSLAKIARALEIAPSIRLGEGEKKSGGWRRDSILSNTLEALIGAIYLDGGIDACASAVTSWFKTALAETRPDTAQKDPKTELQEYLQARRLPLPDYETVETTGAPHKQEFTVRCTISVLSDPVFASGSSRRRAEQSVAQSVLDVLHNRDAQR